MRTVYPYENNIVLDENSVERRPCINREIKSLELTIYLYCFHDININFLLVVTPLSIDQKDIGQCTRSNKINDNFWKEI